MAAEGFKWTPESLSKTFVTYHKELIVMPMLGMSELTQHCSIRTGIRYKDIVTQMGGNFEIGNYKKDKKGTGTTEFQQRTFQTYFGNDVEPIDPNSIYESILGSNITKGDGLKKVPIVLQVCSYIMKKYGENLLANAFTAKHDPTKFESTSDYFDSFGAIIDKDISGNNEVNKVLISEEIGNLEYGTSKIDENNAEDIIKNFFWHRNKKLRTQKLKYFMSDWAYHCYCEDYQISHGALPYNQTYDKKTLEGASNVEIVPLSCVPDDFLLLTPKSNIFCLYNQKTDDETFVVEKSNDNHYDVDMIANMFYGEQFQSVSPEVFAVYKYKEKPAAGAGA